MTPDDKLPQPEGGDATITIRMPGSVHRYLATAAASEGTTVEAAAEQHLIEAVRDKLLKKGRGRPNKQFFDELYDDAIDFLLVTEVSRRPKGKISQTIKHLERQEPFKGHGDLRSRYNRKAKQLRDKHGLKELPRSVNGREEWHMRIWEGGELYHPKKILEAINALRHDAERKSLPNTKRELADLITRSEKIAWLMDAAGYPLPAEMLSQLEKMKLFEDIYGQE
jgi:hypothetical protein